MKNTKINLIKELKNREIIVQISNEKLLSERLAVKPIKLYCGFDPTADSLHLGHLMPLLCLKRFQLSGHQPIILIGGATGLIGDPSFKIGKRKTNSIEIIQEWTEKIERQILTFFDFSCNKKNVMIINNYNWFRSINVISFLREVGKHFSVNQMINKDVIKNRLNRDGIGISFTEFSYNLLQSYDFAYLNKYYGVRLQIGGSDQWGNITSGINLTRRLCHKKVFGLTIPLITKSNGIKFGKTENDTIWLDSTKTSPYKFYQFWVNVADSDVFRFLRFFTFLHPDEINEFLQKNYNKDTPLFAQRLLAEEVTRIVHGDHGLTTAKRITKSLFLGTLKDLTENDFIQLAKDGIPTVKLKHDMNLQLALVAAKLAPSQKQARTLIRSNAISVNEKKQISENYIFEESDRLYKKYTLIRRGKKHFCLLNWV
ncbi:tyrosine--tRNA ligase [Sodalis sp. CWE]|uniref:tyrosine--tRNA ligase n=1 Tax=Sodalis sp. CWE TaxID=2803816 RepID=UPI001C7D586C|nr:tyrosine--tRNA ligase [Sodalis sp. CWE]MBX4181150.1 tyrosine--tRNA ligase [Sodalis sp. CWE]